MDQKDLMEIQENLRLLGSILQRYDQAKTGKTIMLNQVTEEDIESVIPTDKIALIKGRLEQKLMQFKMKVRDLEA